MRSQQHAGTGGRRLRRGVAALVAALALMVAAPATALATPGGQSNSWENISD